jgi:hypothetical protein
MDMGICTSIGINPGFDPFHVVWLEPASYLLDRLCLESGVSEFSGVPRATAVQGGGLAVRIVIRGIMFW